MFGYVKPVNSELLVKEYEFYKATYCGVCRSMKALTGGLSNVLHSYDSVFLALLRMLFVPDEDIKATKARCVAHPVKRRGMLCRNEATDYTARAFGILTYYKLKDDLADERLGKRILTNLLCPIFASASKKAALSNIASACEDKLGKISELERNHCKSADEPAALFGELLGIIFSEGIEGNDAKVLYTVGFHLGKFIYSADAAEDYEADRKSGSYNPFVELYGRDGLTKENKESIKCALLLECRGLELAVNLLPFGRRAVIENIIRNIIYLGLPSRIKFLDCEADGEEKNKKAVTE